ncbi:MAG: pentapeptide repeat-containing protein [Desulfobulbaceae bacterium]|nr:pentapeptide repeat-containing protein [Desulfobulbaceae bacterium]
MNRELWIKTRFTLIIGFIILTLFLIVIGYSFVWTGFGQYTTGDNVERAKTLWDWLDLIVAPLILAIVGIAINSTIRQNERVKEEKQAQSERWLAEDRMKEDALQSFLDRIEDLLTNYSLYDTKADNVLRNIARTRTLTTLRRVDPARKSILLHFLIDSNLVNNKNGAVIIDLSGADLQRVELHDVNLEGALLSEANLHRARLDHCSLKNAILIDTNLHKSSLMYCSFEQAVFSPEIHLARAQITDLRGANLTAANLKGTYLQDVLFDEDTILPDNSRWTPGHDLRHYSEDNFTGET